MTELELLISKPSAMPKRIANSESFKQAINYYHKVMLKRLEGLKQSSGVHHD